MWRYSEGQFITNKQRGVGWFKGQFTTNKPRGVGLKDNSQQINNFALV